MQSEFFMELALDQAKQALSEGEFPVGCVIECNGNVIATSGRINTTKNNTNEIDHAEIIALKKLANLAKPINKDRLTLYCTLEPCLMCFAAIILSNITRIVYAYEDVMGGGTNCNLSQLAPLYKESKISVVPNMLRKKSLSLFKTFFKNSKNDYWKGSLLARYTLEQPLLDNDV